VGRGLVAWARFQGDGGEWRRQSEEAVVGVEELVEAAPEGAVLCGEGAWGLSALLRERFGGRAAVIASPPPTRQLWALARLGAEAQATGRADDRAALQPQYLRQPSITPPRVR
jgi:tRNA A37 threonylcarbamoyladenosine modification protein TsaB